MFHRIRSSYASVTATLALFVALGGGAYAATALPRNSVGARQIKKNAVERAKIKKNAVDSSKVRDDALTGFDIQEATLAKVPAASAADSAATATHAGAATALDKVNYRTAAAAAAPMSPSVGATATCDAGQHVVGGGVRVDNPEVVVIDDSYPDGGGTAWTAHIATGDVGTNFTVYAICVTASAIG